MCKWCALLLIVAFALTGTTGVSPVAAESTGTTGVSPVVAQAQPTTGETPVVPVGGARAAEVEASMPDHAHGTFVQRKTLADVEVTITSTGTFRFEKGKFFEWNTLKPLPSTFIATPTNYTLTVNGKKTTRRLKSDVDQIAKIFEIKEVKDFVKDVTSRPATGFPNEVTVSFKNGDILHIEMKREGE